MPNFPYKKPTPDEFGQIVSAAGGNLSSVARSLGVARSTISEWIKADPDFRQALKDERSKLFDEALATARTVALGLPAYEVVMDDNGNPVRDENGKVKRQFAGWIEKPSEGMLRYLLTRFDPDVEEGPDVVRNGVGIKAWIMKQNEGE